MAIAPTLEEYLRVKGVEFDLVTHPHTAASWETAHAARLRGSFVGKAVVLADEHGYLMAVVPATHHIQLAWLDRLLQRKLGLVTEDDLASLFPDCEVGAVPPFGPAYGVRTVVDEALFELPEVYLEAGDHESLVRMSGRQFRALMHGHKVAPFSLHL
jgi:Ala-tRNA(Pro) deacylase